MVANDRRWYVVHTYAGSEERVKANLEQRIKSMNSEDVFEVLIPTEDEVEVHEGKRRVVPKKIFPGYVLVEMRMTPESWEVVRNAPGVTGFVGNTNQPVPLTEKEISRVLRRMEVKEPRVKVGLSKGERVRITDGPFVDFIGTIDTLNHDKGKARVLVSFFGRETPVELDFLQLERL
ncbi:MAG: transcription termination/antitermination protein NusG [Chloroflexota bacterium]|nr:transcription termination/antitermination protein NusG [Chloroflexota bacterium]